MHWFCAGVAANILIFHIFSPMKSRSSVPMKISIIPPVRWKISATVEPHWWARPRIIVILRVFIKISKGYPASISVDLFQRASLRM